MQDRDDLNGMTTVLGLLKWKTEIKTYDRSGRLDETFWRMTREVRLGHEEILLDGTAQSVRNEETLRDRSGRPDYINSQEEARPQFVIGNDETELELSVEFVNRVNDQVRKRQKRISNVTGDGEEHSLIWNVYVCNNGISGIHGKELPKQLSFHCEFDRSRTETSVRHIYKIGARTR